MAKTEVKFKGSASLGQLEKDLEAEEALSGELQSLEAVLDHTVASFDDSSYPPRSSLGLLPSVGGQAPNPGSSSSHLFNGKAVVLGTKMDVSVYRQS